MVLQNIETQVARGSRLNSAEKTVLAPRLTLREQRFPLETEIGLDSRATLALRRGRRGQKPQEAKGQGKRKRTGDVFWGKYGFLGNVIDAGEWIGIAVLAAIALIMFLNPLTHFIAGVSVAIAGVLGLLKAAGVKIIPTMIDLARKELWKRAKKWWEKRQAKRAAKKAQERTA